MPSSPTTDPQPAPGTPALRHRVSLIAALRAATAGQHAEVERLTAMERLMSPAVAWADYRDYLVQMGRVYGALEPPHLAMLERGLAGRPQLRPPVRPKLPALAEDLAALGLAPPDPSPHPADGPSDLAAAVGGLYVLEGATLGGRVIARHLRARLGSTPESPLVRTRFLDFHGSAASAAWKSFAAALERLAAEGLAEPEAAVAGARKAFDRVYAMLQAADRPSVP